MGNLSNDIIKYKKGEMSPQEMHALEKKALVDPFLAEALEGLEGISSNELTDDISTINKKITKRRKTLFTPLRIAAGIGLLLGSAFFIYQLVPKPETIALKMEKPKPEIKNTESEKAGSGSQTKAATDEKAVDQSGTSKVEEQKRKVESPVQESDKPKSPLKHEARPTTKKELSERKIENSEAEITSPVQQAPALDLASQEQQVKIAEDQKAKEVTGLGQKAAGAKASSERKKNSFGASEVQRSAAPSMIKIELPKSISGKVVSSEDGMPLPGVNVILKGTTLGTVTDFNGDYKISADPDNRTLVFSFIGLQVQEIDAFGRDKIDVQMKDDVSQLSEVVVTALGISKDDQDEPVMKWAEPEGGRKAYDNYLESNVKYPEEALKNKVKGKAGIEFTVGTDGNLSGFRVIKKLGYGCEDEIIRLVKSGPRWNPTTEDNKPIESTVRVRLRFDPAKTGR